MGSGIGFVNDYLEEMLLHADAGVKIEFDRLDRNFKAVVEGALGKEHALVPKYIKMRDKLESSFNARSVKGKEECRRVVYDFLNGKSEPGKR